MSKFDLDKMIDTLDSGDIHRIISFIHMRLDEDCENFVAVFMPMEGMKPVSEKDPDKETAKAKCFAHVMKDMWYDRTGAYL